MSVEILTEANLASYLQVTIPSGAASFVLRLANGLVNEIVQLVEGDPIPVRVEAITAEAAARAYRNPKGLSSETKAIDDFNKTQRWEAAGRTGVYLTDDEKLELAEIRLSQEAPRTRPGSIPLSVPSFARRPW